MGGHVVQVASSNRHRHWVFLSSCVVPLDVFEQSPELCLEVFLVEFVCFGHSPGGGCIATHIIAASLSNSPELGTGVLTAELWPASVLICAHRQNYSQKNA